MTILQIATGLQKASGVTTFVENVSAELLDLGYDVKVFTRSGVPRPYLPPQDIHRGTVVHIHGLWEPWLHRWAVLARKAGLPVVWSTHGMTAPWAMQHKRWKKLPCWWLYQHRDLKSAAMIHCTTDLEVEWNHSLGLNRTFVAPLGTNLPVIYGTDSKNSDLSLLFVGRVYPVKALDNVIKALALVPKSSVRRIHLRIVGPDQAGHQAELQRLCESLGLTESVTFAGPRYGAALSSEYDKCDVLILPSHTENFGATVIDALAHAKPALASTNTPWKILADSNCGWWVDNSPETLAKTFAEIAALPERDLIAMGARGRKLVEDHYAWPAVAKKMVEVYQLNICP